MISLSKGALQLVVCTLLAFAACSAAILAALSKNEKGGYNYNTSTIPFMAESLKLMISLWFLLMEFINGGSDKIATFQLVSLGSYLLLGLLYACQNNLLFLTLKHVDAAFFQVVINLKIPLTALLAYLFLKKIFSIQQIFALFLLVIGASISQISDKESMGNTLRVSSSGTFFLSCMIVISSSTAILNEFLLKKESLGSLHWQNTQLYIFSCFFCSVKLFSDSKAIFSDIFFAGFNAFTWLSVINMAFLGIMTSAVLKYADNLLRAFSSAASVLLATFLAWQFLNVNISAGFLLGAILICLAILLYTEVFDIHKLFTHVTEQKYSVPCYKEGLLHWKFTGYP